MIVGTRHRHHFRDTELAQSTVSDGAELGRVPDGAGRDNRALTLHQPRHGGDRADAAWIGEHDGGAAQLVRRQLAGAGLCDQRLVLIAEGDEVEPVRVVDHGDEQGAAAVLPLHIDREAQVHPAGNASRRTFDPIKRNGHRRHVLHCPDDGEGDQVGVGDFLRAPGLLDRLVQLPPSLIEQIDSDGAKTRRRRDLATLLHVLDERGSGAPQRDRAGG